VGILYRNKINKKLYALTTPADSQGICQVLDPATNYLVLMPFEELEEVFLHTSDHLTDLCKASIKPEKTCDSTLLSYYCQSQHNQLILQSKSTF